MPNLTTTICENVKIIVFSHFHESRGGRHPTSPLGWLSEEEVIHILDWHVCFRQSYNVRTASSELKFQSWLVSPFLAVSYEYAHFCAFFSSSHSYFFLCEVLRWWKVSKSYQLTIKWKGALTRRLGKKILSPPPDRHYTSSMIQQGASRF